MATVIIQKRKRKSGISYAVRYKDPVSRISKHHGTYRKMKEAQSAANDLRSFIDSGKKPQPKKTRFTPLRFNEVASLLSAQWKTKNARNEMKHKTMYDYGIWLSKLCDRFGSMFLCEITKNEIEDFVYSIAETTSSVNANKHLAAIKKVFRLGLLNNAVSDDVTIEIQRLQETARNSFLFPDELDKLIETTQATRAKYYMPAIIYLGAEHGASKQEILSLQWRDIQFDNIPEGLIRFFRTKNKKERTEFIMPRTNQALTEWKNHLELKRNSAGIAKIKSDAVFCRIDGTPIKCFNKAWWAALRSAGIKNFHFHDLRHTFCSNLIMAGGGLKDAKEMIGHADIAMTDRYSHLTGLHKRNLQLLLSNHYKNGTVNK